MRLSLLPALVALLVIAPARAGAQEITFDEALALTEDAPELQAAERALRARIEGDARISDTITSPTELQLMPGARVLAEQDRGFEGQIGIVQGWSLSGLGGARRRAAEEERAAMAASRRALALGRRLGAARAWLELAVLERQVALATAELQIVIALRESIERAADAGVMTAADASEARASEGDAELRTITVEAERIAALLALAAMMGARADEGARTAGRPPSPDVPDHDALAARLSDVEGLPQVEMTRLAAVAERAREVELAAAGGATMQTGVQLYREAPDGFMVFGLLSFGIPLADLTARERSRASAEAERLEGEHAAQVLSARREAIAVAHEVERGRREERVLRDSLVPSLERLVEQRETQLRAGETTIVLLLEARRRLIAAQVRLAQVEGARRWAEVRAWLMLAVRAQADRGARR